MADTFELAKLSQEDQINMWYRDIHDKILIIKSKPKFFYRDIQKSSDNFIIYGR